MSTWRLIETETHTAFANMAIDEAILRARMKGKVTDTVRFYRWQPSAVSIGRFQNIHNVVNLENCTRNGVDVVRRISGGGAVYHDSTGELTYSVIVAREELGTDDVIETYNLICNGLIKATPHLGVETKYDVGDSRRCPNITVKTRKISGSAQAIKKNVILQHGTLLMNVDLERMFKFLKAPKGASEAEIVDFAKRKITSVESELGKPVSIDQACEALRKGFEEALRATFRVEKLTNYELRLAEELKNRKFSVEEWNLKGESYA